jgi:transposase-like protein
MSSERRTRSRDDWKQLISEQQQSGLSVKAFCQKQGVGDALFYSWRKRIAEERSTRFALVATNGTVASPPALQRLQLVLPSGERLEIPSSTDEATLRTVLGLLRERV